MVKKTNLKAAEKEYVNQVVNETQLALYAMAKEWDEQRHVGMQVIIESIRDDFKVYGDSINGIHDELKIMNGKINNIQEDVAVLKEDVAVLKEDVYMLKGDVEQIKEYIFKNVEPRIHVLEFRDREMA